ncbi:AMP-binding protein [Chitinivorax sp. B]|uniref:AMP-binding protein n=1 Tax=Chitinivorax sp. B TaxID=2502235 RepID=UPI001485C130|nr:AMP-binding protein [Chitinivorax sp. B]
MSEIFKPALSQGGPLNHPVKALSSLAAALARAAAADEQIGIHVVDRAGQVVFFSYREVYQRAQAIAARLLAAGARPGSNVLIRLADPMSFLLAFWGAVVGGFAVVPLAASNPWPDDELALRGVVSALKQLDATVMWVAGDELERVASAKARFGWDELTVINGDMLSITTADAEPIAVSERCAADLAVIFPTSGSTGVPKPVMQTGDAILSMCAGGILMNDFSPTDCFLNWMPMDHVGAVVFLGVLPVCAGASQVHIAHGLVRQDVTRWLDFIEQYRATVTWVPNYVFHVVAKALLQRTDANWDLSSMRFLVNAGESISTRFAEHFVDRLAQHGLRRQSVRPAFGMSETCSGITWPTGLSVVDGRYASLGKPIAGAEIRIVDEQGAVLLEGDVGALQVKGPSVTCGYYNAGQDEKFLVDGWFDTGDRAFILNGELYMTDREGDGIDVAGQNLHSYELEAQLEELTGVAAGYCAVCKVVEQGRTVLGVFYCAEQGGDAVALLSQIQQVVAQQISDIAVHYFPCSQTDIPRTSIGKIQRKALRRRLVAWLAEQPDMARS